MWRTHRQLIAGIALMIVGVAGLIAIAAPRWYGEEGVGEGPRMPGFGEHHMFGPGRGGGVLAPVPGARTVDIVATDFAFGPSEITVKAGEGVNIRVVNQGTMMHDLMIPAARIHFAVAPGQAMVTGLGPLAPGQYEFFCGLPGHRQAGMVGRITVTP